MSLLVNDQSGVILLVCSISLTFKSQNITHHIPLCSYATFNITHIEMHSISRNKCIYMYFRYYAKNKNIECLYFFTLYIVVCHGQ